MDDLPAPLTNPEIRKLKAEAQRLKPILKIGKSGVTPQFLKSVDGAFTSHQLIKIKFDDFKDQKKVLAPQLAEQTKSELITLLGNVVVLYRRKPAFSATPRPD
jgi:RNA-binding protein